MNPEVKLLIPAIVSFINERNRGISKTKLLKILYLFDVEYFRLYGKLFTGFDWKFFHLGPWTSEFEPVLSELVGAGQVEQEYLQSEEYEIALLRTADRFDLDQALPDAKAAIQLNRILMDWGARSTGELLNYVYFQTEPMEHGVRNERLDFSWVQSERLPKYSRSLSGTKPGALARKKREYQARLARTQTTEQSSAKITPAKYDDVFFRALETMERRRT